MLCMEYFLVNFVMPEAHKNPPDIVHILCLGWYHLVNASRHGLTWRVLVKLSGSLNINISKTKTKCCERWREYKKKEGLMRERKL